MVQIIKETRNIWENKVDTLGEFYRIGTLH